MWLKKDDHISVMGKIPRRSEMNFQIAYRRRDGVETFGRSLKFELSVALDGSYLNFETITFPRVNSSARLPPA